MDSQYWMAWMPLINGESRIRPPASTALPQHYLNRDLNYLIDQSVCSWATTVNAYYIYTPF